MAAARPSKDNPRLLRHVKTGDEVRCMDPAQHLELTSARGYRDVTDEATGPAGTTDAATETPAAESPGDTASSSTGRRTSARSVAAASETSDAT